MDAGFNKSFDKRLETTLVDGSLIICERGDQRHHDSVKVCHCAGGGNVGQEVGGCLSR